MKLLFATLALFLVLFTASASAAVYNCNSCSSCTSAIQGAASGDTVQLTQGITGATGSSGSGCISFGGKDGITFDCLGNTISGTYSGVPTEVPPWYFGIWLSGASNNNNVRNCVTTNLYHGVFVNGSNGNNLTNIVSNMNFQHGIFIYYSSNNQLNSVQTNQNFFTGLYIYDGQYNTVSGIVCNSNDGGIYIDQSVDNTISGASCSDNDWYGVVISYTNYNTITGSTFQNNHYGIGLFNWSYYYTNQNSIYNNFFSNTINVNSLGLVNQPNYFSTALNCTAGPNIRGQPCIGGNYWSNPSGNGFSDTCIDANADGICDSSLTLLSGNIDYYPLSSLPAETNPPNSVLNPYSPDPTSDNTPTYAGTATDSQNNVFAVQYRVNGGAWINAQASDGAFNSPTEGFTFTPSALADGTYIFEVRAQDSAGNWETTYGSDTLTISTGAIKTCTDCASCTAQIQASNSGDVVQLTQNIVITYPPYVSTCIEFNGKDNIIFDCVGHTIDGVTTRALGYPLPDTGINMSWGSDNNTIRNCVMLGFYNAIRIDHSSGNNITSNFMDTTAAPVGQAGVNIQQSDHNIIDTLSTTGGYAFGIIVSGYYNTIRNVNSQRNGVGIYLGGGGSSGGSAMYNTVSNCISNNNQRGFALYYYNNAYNTIRNCRVEGNSQQGVYLYGYGYSANYNSFYNNYFNNSVNYFSPYSDSNYWNTTLSCSSGPNIIGAPCMGGNYWANPSGNGFSDTCIDASGNGICDSSYSIDSYNVDYYPISRVLDTIPPSVPTGLTAVASSSTTVTLGWNAASDNYMVMGYRIYRNGTYIGWSPNTYYSDSGLSPETTYTYRVSAYDAAGNEGGQSLPASATTPALPDTTPPSVPSNLQAVAVSTSQINLTWNAATDNVGVAGYYIFRGGIWIGWVAGTAYQDTGLSPSTTYTYNVAAFDAAFNTGGQSSPASATTLSGDVTPPDTFLNAYAPDPSTDNTPTYTGTATDTQSSVIAVQYRVNGGAWINAQASDGAFNSPNEGFTFTPAALADGTYIFEVGAQDSAGNWETTYGSDTLAIDTTPPVTTLNSYSPDPTTDNTPTYTGTATDSASSIAAVQYRVNGGAWQAASPSDGAFNSPNEGFTFTPSALADGTYIFETRAQDSAGNWEVSYGFDMLTVQVSCVIQSANAILNDANLNGFADINEIVFMSSRYAGDCSAVRFLQIDASGTGCSVQYSVPPGNLSGISNGSGLRIGGGYVNGTWGITSIPTACSSRTVTVTQAAFYNPGPPPTGIISLVSSPSAGGSFTFRDVIGPDTLLDQYAPDPSTDNTPTYTGTATDSASSIAAVQYRVNGGAWINAQASDGAFNSPTEGFTFTPSALADGTHIFETRAQDSAGNWEITYGSDTLAIDTTPPVISFVAPTPANNTNVTENYIQVNVSLSQSPNACILSWYSGAWANYTMAVQGFSCYINMTGLANYTYQFRVYANDSSGNMGTSENRQNGVAYSPPDTTPPSLFFVSPTPANNTQVNDSWAFINASSNEILGSCVLDWGNGTYSANESMAVYGTYCSLNKTSLVNGTYVFRVYANDQVGNWNSTGIVYLEASVSSSCINEADIDCDGCLEMLELARYIDRWKINNLDVTMAEMMLAIGVWKTVLC